MAESTKAGSVKIELTGTEDAYRVLCTLFRNQTLTDLCGLAIKDITFLEDAKADEVNEMQSSSLPIISV